MSKLLNLRIARQRQRKRAFAMRDAAMAQVEQQLEQFQTALAVNELAQRQAQDIRCQ